MISLWERSQSIEEEIIKSVCWCNKFGIKKEKQKNLMFFSWFASVTKNCPCVTKEKKFCCWEKECVVCRDTLSNNKKKVNKQMNNERQYIKCL